VLQFWINGHMMGEEFDIAPEEPRRIRVRALGTERIDRLVIIKDNEPFHLARLDSDTVDVSVVDDALLERNSFYYVRLIQVDGELAWASPIWVSPRTGA
jgi:hypothetical protein